MFAGIEQVAFLQRLSALQTSSHRSSIARLAMQPNFRRTLNWFGQADSPAFIPALDRRNALLSFKEATSDFGLIYALVPVIAIKIAELHRFGQMLGGNVLGPVEVGDRSGHAQHAIMSARGKIHAADGHFECSFAALIEST